MLYNNQNQMRLDGKVIDDWDFRSAKTKYLTHGIHDYPARMIPQIAKKLIDKYSNPNDTILDPFCGSGTILLEALLNNRNAIGSDINSFALLLAKVKSTPIDFNKDGFNLSDFLSKLKGDLNTANKDGSLPEPPVNVVPNLLHWFKEYVTRDLEFIYQKILSIENNDVKDFLLVVFSKTLFDTSNINHRSSRFIRILPKIELDKFKPDVITEFTKNLIQAEKMILDLNRKVIRKKLSIQVRNNDARSLEHPDKFFDAVITSPPYGEEKNTISYERWSKLSSAWLRLIPEKKSDKLSLGCIVTNDYVNNINQLQSPTAQKLLKSIVGNDPVRVKDALPFFLDYQKTFHEVLRVLKDNSAYCVVIGDRSIRKKHLDMEKVSVELAKSAGFKHEKTYVRTIPMKLIPWDTPTGKTISRESIIIFRR